jgi:hypothetical protein
MSWDAVGDPGRGRAMNREIGKSGDRVSEKQP